MKRQATTTQFFYQSGKLVTVNQSGQKRAIFRSTDIPLAELSTGKRQETGLLEVDQNGSVLNVSGDADAEEHHSYSAYGHDPSLPSQRTMAGFNGEHIEAVAAGYLLGNGYRLFDPTFMRFLSADNLSPFDDGGINPYAYCGCDPVNRVDPTGHNWFSSFVKGTKNLLGLRKKTPKASNHSPDLASIVSNDGRPTTPLPKYTKEAIEGHTTQGKATNLLRQDIDDTIKEAHKYKIQRNRHALSNVQKTLKGQKVSTKDKLRVRTLTEKKNQALVKATKLSKNQQLIRQGPPPPYEN